MLIYISIFILSLPSTIDFCRPLFFLSQLEFDWSAPPPREGGNGDDDADNMQVVSRKREGAFRDVHPLVQRYRVSQGQDTL